MTMQQTKDIDGLFFPKLDEIAAELGAQSEHMLAVMYSESGCRADAHNDNPKSLPPDARWNASGLIQFMPATLLKLGWTHGHSAFRRLSATEQLPFVRRYYRPHTGHLNSVGGLYVATFLPALITHAGDPSFVLTARGGPLGWAYAPNAAFDINGDYAITVGELEAAVQRNAVGARWDELLVRLGAGTAPVDREPEGFDLRTTMGIQRSLERLGFEPGIVDGVPGPQTRSAVAAFQSSHGLIADGIFGPTSREEMARALRMGGAA